MCNILHPGKQPFVYKAPVFSPTHRKKHTRTTRMYPGVSWADHFRSWQHAATSSSLKIYWLLGIRYGGVVLLMVSKESPTGPTERTPKKPEYLITLATYLGVRWMVQKSGEQVNMWLIPFTRFLSSQVVIAGFCEPSTV